MKSDELISSLSIVEIEQFAGSRFWQAVEETIKDRLEIIRTELEVGQVVVKDAEGKMVGTKVCSLEELVGKQRECASLRYVLMIPEIFREQKVDESKKEEKEEAKL